MWLVIVKFLKHYFLSHHPGRRDESLIGESTADFGFDCSAAFSFSFSFAWRCASIASRSDLDAEYYDKPLILIKGELCSPGVGSLSFINRQSLADPADCV
jgi:hypothetical protein